MKKVCFSIPCYNEEENIELMTRAIDALFQEKYKGIYEYVIEYIDNYSTDRTREVLQKLCERYPHNEQFLIQEILEEFQVFMDFCRRREIVQSYCLAIFRCQYLLLISYWKSGNRELVLSVQ